MLLENDLYPEDVRVRDEAHSLRDAGYRVHVIAPRGEGRPRTETLDGITVERFWLPRELGGGVAPLLLEYAVAHIQLYGRAFRALWRGADVLHFHNPPDTLFVPAAVGRALGRRAVFDMHDLFPELLVTKFGRSPLFRVAVALQVMSARTADLILVTNESQRNILLGRARVAPDRVRVVRNGPPAFALDRSVTTRTGRLEDPRLIYVGALEAQDGIDHIPALLERLLGRPGLSQLTLTVVGWGTRRKFVEEELARRGLGEHVTFTGRVSHDDVLRLVAEADICIDLAVCNELNHRTTMVKIAEYLSLGKPTVSFALNETVSTGGDAVAFAACDDWEQYGELIRRLCHDDEFRLDLARRARERAALLTWDHSAATLVDAYQHMLARRA